MNFINDYIMVRIFSQAKMLLQRCSYGIRKIFKIYGSKRVRFWMDSFTARKSTINELLYAYKPL